MQEDKKDGLPVILLVEDNATDYESIVRAFKRLEVFNKVFWCKTGEEALDFLYKRGEYGLYEKAERPDIILMDLNLPGTDGREVIEEVKKDSALKSIPIIVLTTSCSQQDINSCYEHGANGYINKPVKWDNLVKSLDAFKKFWLETALFYEKVD